MPDLTPEEIAAFRLVRLRFHGPRQNRSNWHFGLRVQFRSLQSWRVSLCFGPVATSVTFQTFAEYRHFTIALGPYRNA